MRASSFPPMDRPWLEQALVGLLVGAAGWFALGLARGPAELAVAWIGNGVLAGWLLSRPTRSWPGYVLWALVADVVARLTATPPLPAFLIGVADMTEVLIVAGVVRRYVPDVGDPKHWISLGGIATGSTLLACAVSGALAAAVVNGRTTAGFGSSFLTWYAAHVVGMVIFATCTLVVHRKDRNLFAPRGRRWLFLADMLLVGVVSVGVFLSPYPILFIAYLPLLLGAFRHGFPGVAGGVLLLTVIGSVATSLGRGPLWLVRDMGAAGHVALLQLYIAGACLLTITVALAMAQRQRLTARLRDSEHRYRMLADYSHDVVVRMRADGQRLYVSPSSRDILGWAPAEMLGSRWDLVHADDRERQARDMAEVLRTGQPLTTVYRVRHRDGHYVWIEAVTRPIPSADGKEVDLIYAGRDISRRVAAEQALAASRAELERLARFDTLTGVANRRQFDERLELALLRLRRHGVPVALLYMDVDHFKGINDTHGHAVGDEVLRTFARRLVGCTRASDLVARLGGDEFAVVIEDAALPYAAEAVAQKLIAEMAQPVLVAGVALHVTTSIGIGFTAVPVGIDTLMASADAALYQAKRAGRNTCRLNTGFGQRAAPEHP